MLLLNNAMRALTTRKPIALTTTSLCSGAFTARIARSQRLRELRVAGCTIGDWARVERDAQTGVFKRCGLDVQTATLPTAAAAVAALSDRLADVAYIDALSAVQACARTNSLQFIAMSSRMTYAYVAIAPVIDAKGYSLARFARALRDTADAVYVESRDLQALVDGFAAEALTDAVFSANDHISSIAVLSGTR